jgi:hypothetical protein
MVVSFFILPGNAQEAATPERPIHNTTVFVEAWGEGVYNSLNIEKTIANPTVVCYHLRMGFGLWAPGAGVNFYALPVDVAISFGNELKGELSIGATPFWLANAGVRTSGALAPTFGAHLRYMHPNGGLFVRAGALIAPLYNLNDIPGNEDHWQKGTWGWNPGIALGTTF